MTHGQGLFSPSLKVKFAESKSGRVESSTSAQPEREMRPCSMGSRVLEPERAVEGARGALQVFGVGSSGMPCDRLAIDGEFDGKILGREASIFDRPIRRI